MLIYLRFVAIMSLVSLVIMVMTQAISTLLGLRGKSLADGMDVLFQKIDPKIDSGCRRQLIDEILTSPVISDSMLSVQNADGVFVRNIPFVRELRRAWMRATDLRSNELLEMIKEKAQGAFGTAVDLLYAMNALLLALPPQGREEKAGQIANAKAAVQSAIAAISTNTVSSSREKARHPPQRSCRNQYQPLSLVRDSRIAACRSLRERD